MGPIETILLIMMLASYLVPTVVAIGGKRSNLAPIIVINVFLGWTLVGWVVALAMAVWPSPSVTDSVSHPSRPQEKSPAALDQLQKLAELHQAGILTDDEFDTKKAELLSRL
jgi:hypothetical protein